MSIKKKLLIALLTATVSVAGAAGFAACDKNPEPTPTPTPEPSDTTGTASVDAEAYEIAVANGYEGTKDEWLTHLEDTYDTELKGIKKVFASASGDVVITYQNDTTLTVPMSVKLYKVICKDSISGDPLSGAWFEIGYIDSSTSSFTNTGSSSNRFAKAGSDGIAVFCVTPETGINYVVKLADPNDVALYLGTPDAPPSVKPENYDPDFGTNNGFPKINLSFDNTRKTEALFANAANNFYNATKTKIPYTRTASGETNSTVGGAFKIDTEANVYNYLYFRAYLEPSTSGMEDDAAQTARDNAAKAASGKYKFTVTPTDVVTMYKFMGSSTYAPLNAKNIPAVAEYVTGGEAGATYVNSGYESGVYTGTNSIILNIRKADVTGESLFGIYSDSDCEITLTVERIGDAEEEQQVEVTRVPVPSNVAAYPAKPEGSSLVLMPVTGALKVVKGTDGYYHVGSENGPVLLVQLNKALSRVAGAPISELPKQKPTEQDEPLGEAALTFSIYGSGKITAIYNYSDVIAAYSAKANSDGVYGVDDTLYNFLVHYGATAQALGAIPNNEYNWLLPCQYYQPEGGMQVSGDGTQVNPYVLMNGKSGIVVSDKAYLTFSAPETGIYTFKVSSGTVSSTSGIFKSTRSGDTLYVCVTSTLMPATFTITASGAVTVEVAQYSRNVTATYDDDTQTTVGTETNPANLLAGISNIIISSVNNDGVWVSFSNTFVTEPTEYIFGLFDDDAEIVYNGITYNSKNQLKVTLQSRDDAVKLLLTKKNSNGNVSYGNFMLRVIDAKDAEPETPASTLIVGNNSISFTDANVAFNGVTYTFTSVTGGTYTMSVEPNSFALIAFAEIGFDEPIIDANDYKYTYVFEVEAGQTISFLISGSYEDPFILKIEEGGQTGDDLPITLGEPKQITVTPENNGYESSFTATSAGTYVITLEIDGIAPASNVTAYYKPENSRAPYQSVVLQLNGNTLTAEFTLSETDITDGPEILFELDCNNQFNGTLTLSLKQA